MARLLSSFLISLVSVYLQRCSSRSSRYAIPAMLEETAGSLLRYLIRVNAFDQRCKTFLMTGSYAIAIVYLPLLSFSLSELPSLVIPRGLAGL